MKILDKVQDKMVYELEDICNKGQMTATDLDYVDKIVDIIKDIVTTKAMLKADKHHENEWSEDDTKTYASKHVDHV